MGVNGDRFTTDLYFECHVTIEPVFEQKLEDVKEIAAKYGFRVAELLMKKRATDSEFRSRYDTFCTGHSKHYDDIQLRMLKLVFDLTEKRYLVWRYKIENTLLDVRLKARNEDRNVNKDRCSMSVADTLARSTA